MRKSRPRGMAFAGGHAWRALKVSGLGTFGLVLAGSGLLISCKGGPDQSPEQAATAASSSLLAVDVVTARAAKVPNWLALTGQIKGARDSFLAANTSGRVTSVLVERGALVKVGAPLLRVDVRVASLQAQEAQTQLSLVKAQAEAARRECDRAEKLLVEKAISQAELDQMRDRCKTADLQASALSSRVALAQQMVGDAEIKAPFAGYIAERMAEVGQYVMPPTPVVHLVEIDPVRLEISVPEAHSALLQPDSDVSFTVSAFPMRTFQGKVRFVSSAVRSLTRDVVVEASVPNADTSLRPGMFASVELAAGVRDGVRIPMGAVLQREGRAHVFVVRAPAAGGAVEGTRLEERIVQLDEVSARGAKTSGEYFVVRGLVDGEQLVSAAVPTLQNGQLIKVGQLKAGQGSSPAK